jgi:translation initiation factor IF-2
VRDDFRGRLEHGQLDEEVEPSGFEALAAMGGSAQAPAARKPSRAPQRPSPPALDTLRAAVKRARERERKLEAEAREAAREAERARRQAMTLEEKAAAAGRKADEAAEARVEAEKRLTDAHGRRSR